MGRAGENEILFLVWRVKGLIDPGLSWRVPSEKAQEELEAWRTVISETLKYASFTVIKQKGNKNG